MQEKNFELFLERFQFLQSKGQSFCVVTLVDAKGSTPQDIGARAIVTLEGIFFGTVGGGKLENHAIFHSVELLKTSKHDKKLLKVNLQKDLGMSCGGEVSLFLETFYSKANWNIAVFGAGHVAQELVPLLQKLDCNIIVIDSRSEWLNKLPKVKNTQLIQSIDMANELKNVPSQSFVALMTMGHSTDLPILENALKNYQFPYVGVIGSQTKAKKIKNELNELGISNEKINSVYCPIGESFGSNSPTEIAFSIVSQLLKIRDQIFTKKT